jgi:hypothetical protein
MAIDWKVVRAEHVSRACELCASGVAGSRVRGKGLVIRYRDRELPAKTVLQHAYRLAKGMPMDAEVRFASGDSTLNLLRKLGFQAERLA